MELVITWRDKEIKLFDELQKEIKGSMLELEYTVQSDTMLLRVSGRSTKYVTDIVTKALARITASQIQLKEIEKLVNISLGKLSKSELGAVSKLTMAHAAENGMSVWDEWYVEKIEKRLRECFAYNKTLNIEGFLKFRMQDFVRLWKKCLEEVICRAVAEFEYWEYIELLKNILKKQKMICRKVIIKCEPSGGYRLFDSNGNSLSIVNITDSDMTANDKLLCSLMAVAPEEIIAENSPRFIASKVFQTINRVFEGKVTIEQTRD